MGMQLLNLAGEARKTSSQRECDYVPTDTGSVGDDSKNHSFFGLVTIRRGVSLDVTELGRSEQRLCQTGPGFEYRFRSR